MKNICINNRQLNMHVKDLKKILNELPDDMSIIIPVIDEDNVNRIYGFRYIRTAGTLVCEYEQDPTVLCLNAAADGQNIADQIRLSGRGRDVSVKKILFNGKLKRKKEN